MPRGILGVLVEQAAQVAASTQLLGLMEVAAVEATALRAIKLAQLVALAQQEVFLGNIQAAVEEGAAGFQPLQILTEVVVACMEVVGLVVRRAQ